MRSPATALTLGIPLLAAAAAAQQPLPQGKVLAADDALGDNYGFAVDLYAERGIVGAWRADAVGMDSGAAYVLVRSGNVWSEEQKLVGSDTNADDEFGAAVAIERSFAFVGAPAANGAATQSGAVYAFARSGSSWSQIQKLNAADGLAGDAFGTALAADAATLLVGAPYDDVGALTDAGSAYVFVESAGTWTQQAKLTPAGTVGGALVGDLHVALDGDLALVGGAQHLEGGIAVGAAWVFRRTGTSWSQEAKLLAADGVADDYFGLALALDGDRALVGAPFDDDLGLMSGAVYVFRAQGTTWSQEQKLVGGGVASLFGSSLALDGTIAAIGAINQSGGGRAYLARRTGTTWALQTPFSGIDTVNADGFGGALALEGGSLLVGAAQDDDAGASSGSAYPYFIAGGFAEFCNGDGGNQLGCTPCPCANTAPAGTVGGCLHAEGRSARLFGTGTPSVAADTLRFELYDARSASFAILTSGTSRAPNNPANPCFGLDTGLQSFILDGLRCVVGSVLRHGSRATNANGDVGTTGAGWGPPHGPTGGLAFQGGFTAGQTRHYQANYRVNPAENCGTQQNTSQGVTVLFQP